MFSTLYWKIRSALPLPIGLLRRDIFLAEEVTEEYKWDNREVRVQIVTAYDLK